jgi:hypothetical protein
MSPHTQWTIDDLAHRDEGVIVAAALRSGTALGISDGSFKNGRCTSAVILEGPTKAQGRIIGTNRVVPGRSQDQSSYRGELGGILCLLSLLQCVITTHSVNSRTGTYRTGRGKSNAGSRRLKPSALVATMLRSPDEDPDHCPRTSHQGQFVLG